MTLHHAFDVRRAHNPRLAGRTATGVVCDDAASPPPDKKKFLVFGAISHYDDATATTTTRLPMPSRALTRYNLLVYHSRYIVRPIRHEEATQPSRPRLKQRSLFISKRLCLIASSDSMTTLLLCLFLFFYMFHYVLCYHLAVI